MEIETYDTRQPGTTKIFIRVIDGDVMSVIVGNRAVSSDRGYQFYVEDHVADQIDKCTLYLDGLTPGLRVKDGVELDVPEKTEKELEIERLKFELEQLESSD